LITGAAVILQSRSREQGSEGARNRPPESVFRIGGTQKFLRPVIGICAQRVESVAVHQTAAAKAAVLRELSSQWSWEIPTNRFKERE
jgi:hypothetical protein